MDWMSVNGWANRGGAELGTHHHLPTVDELPQIAQTLERYQINGLLIIGGWAGYQAASQLCAARPDFPAFHIPIVCLPAAIDNNLPGSELSIGADTALNSIVAAVDKIQQSAVASQLCFIVEVMGHECGYLAAMSGLATGAERVYLPEEGVSLNDMRADIAALAQGFQNGKRLGLVIRNEDVNPHYTTGFMQTLFDEEGGQLFDARQAILGHLQQGGNPSPFDRIHATRLAALCMDRLIDEALRGSASGVFIGLQAGQVTFHNLEDFPHMIDTPHQRPKEQWWMALRSIAKVLAQPAPRHQLRRT
jgi:6-phosphofructokinase 1